MIIIRYVDPTLNLRCTKTFDIKDKRVAQDFIGKLQLQNIHPDVKVIKK